KATLCNFPGDFLHNSFLRRLTTGGVVGRRNFAGGESDGGWSGTGARAGAASARRRFEVASSRARRLSTSDRSNGRGRKLGNRVARHVSHRRLAAYVGAASDGLGVVRWSGCGRLASCGGVPVRTGRLPFTRPRRDHELASSPAPPARSKGPRNARRASPA